MRKVTLAAPRKVGRPAVVTKSQQAALKDIAVLLAKHLRLPKPTIRYNAKTSGKNTYHALEFGKGLTELRIFVDLTKNKIAGQAVSKKWKEEFPTTAFKDLKKYLGMDKDSFFDRYIDAITDFSKKLGVAIKPYKYKVLKPTDTGTMSIGKNTFVLVESNLPIEVLFDPKANVAKAKSPDKQVQKHFGAKPLPTATFLKTLASFLDDYEE